MSNISERKKQFMSQIDDLFGFNLTNREDTVSYDFGQYKLNKIYKPLVKYFINEFHDHLEEYDELEAEKILGLFLDFYSLYYNHGDFGYFKNRFSTYEYRIPYSGKDTEFWWATKDCYYVKTSDVVNDMAVSLGGLFEDRDAQLKFFKKTQAEVDDNGKETYLFGVEVEEQFGEENEEIIGYNITFINREDGKERKSSKNKIIYETLKEYDIDTKDEPIKSTLDDFLKKRGRDYFIHKRLKSFLTEELERYFFQMLKTDLQAKADILSIQTKIEEIKVKYSDDPEVVEFKIGQLMKESKPDTQLSVYETAYLWILNFANILGDLEDFKAKLWNKKRKVIKQEYCISLGKLPDTIREQVVQNSSQQKEREKMGMTANKGSLFDDLTLVVDTRLFSGPLKEKLVQFASNEEIIGELYHSDNYQALKYMQEEYLGKIKCVYIDPPYNTGGDGFIYKDSYQNASWLSLMNDRLLLGKSLLSDTGVIFSNIDDNEVENLRKLMNNIFLRKNLVCNVIWQHSIQPKAYDNRFSGHHNYMLIYRKTDNFTLGMMDRTEEDNKSYSNPDNDPKGDWRTGDVRSSYANRPNLLYKIETPSGNFIDPPELGWRWSEDRMLKMIEDGEVIFNENEDGITRKIYLKNQDGRTPESLWLGKKYGTTRDGNRTIKNLFGEVNFGTPKPVLLIKKVTQVANLDNNGIVLDFFAGSGTTGHAVINLNKKDGGERKFILVELGKYFDSVTLPRIKKVMYSDNRKDGVAQDSNGTQGIVSYKQLNQYEDWFSEGGYLSDIDSEIQTFKSTDISEIQDIKNILYPLRELKEKIYRLDEE